MGAGGTGGASRLKVSITSGYTGVSTEFRVQGTATNRKIYADARKVDTGVGRGQHITPSMFFPVPATVSYQGRIKAAEKRVSLGSFNDDRSAAKAYDKCAPTSLTHHK
jgi:hypothetical protein